MFVKYSNNIIQMVRGDSGSFTLFINKGSILEPEQYIIQPNVDEVVFYLTEAQEPFEDAILEKHMTSADLDQDNNIVVNFVPADTLDIESGVYFYEIKLHHTNQDQSVDVNTIIPKKQFIIFD